MQLPLNVGHSISTSCFFRLQYLLTPWIGPATDPVHLPTRNRSHVGFASPDATCWSIVAT